MVQSKLYNDAFARFKKQATAKYTDPKDRAVLNQFLQERGKPEEAKAAAELLCETAGEKYGGGGGFGTWKTAILDNIGNVIAIGNYATTGAPESVGLAWYAVRLTLGAIQNNYDLYNFFGTGLSDISEIMIIIQHYDHLYDETGKDKRWKPSTVVAKLFEDIIETYVAVLDFSLTVKRHLEGNVIAKLRHGLKDFFGFQKPKFEGKLAEIAKLKIKMLEGSQAAFQDRTLTGLEGMKEMVDDVRRTVDRIQDFQHVLKDLHKQQVARLDELQEQLAKKIDDVHDDVKYIKDLVKPKTAWELAVQGFDKVRKTMFRSANDTRAAFREQGKMRLDGTCGWIFDEEKCCKWMKTPGWLLCINGAEGTGKSTLLSVVASKLEERREDTRTTMLHASCGRNVDSLYRALLYQLYSVAYDERTQPTALLEGCTKVFLTQTNPVNPHHQGQEDLPDFVSTFKKLAELLKADALVVVDSFDRLPPDERERLSACLYKLLTTFMTDEDSLPRLRVLVGTCTPFKFPAGKRRPFNRNHLVHKVTMKSSSFRSPLILKLGRDGPSGHKHDLERKLVTSLQEVSRLSEEEQSLASQRILEKAGGRFTYIDRAIEFMRQPLQRPLENHLKLLPETGGDTSKYDAELLKIGPTYVPLLRKALTWSLLGKVWPQAVVVMEDFSGLYKTPGSWEVEGTNPDTAGFPALSGLDVEQLRAASGPFFSLRDDEIVVQDYDQVSTYCLAESHMADQHKAGGICTRCQSEIAASKSLSISRRDGHLDLAIACLTHINCGLFQRRAGLLEEPTSESTVIPSTNPPADFHVGAPKGSNESRKPSRTYGISETRGNFGRRFDDGDDSDDSMDSDEQQDPVFFEPNLDDNDANLPPSRYEIQHWPYHLREADDEWTPGERTASKKWAQLFSELDKLVKENTGIFNAWRSKYRTSASAIFSFAQARKPLHIAAYLGLTSWAERLIADGENVNEVSGGCNTVQAAAVGAPGRLSMLRLLLENGADINAETATAPPAFHMWLSGDASAEAVDLLIKNGADPALKAQASGWMALHHFAQKGTDVKALEALMSKGGSHNNDDMINATTNDGHQPLHLLLSRPEVPLEVLKAFVMTYKADVNAETSHSERPLQLATRLGDVEALQILMGSGVLEIDDEDNDGNTALHHAVIYDQPACVSFLVDCKADPDHGNKRGTTALHQAARLGHYDYVQLMLANPIKTDMRGRSALCYACKGKSEKPALEILGYMLPKPFPVSEINKPTHASRTPLQYAAARGFNSTVTKLIDAAKAENNDMTGLAIDLQDTKAGMTALHRAAAGGHLRAVIALLDAGADVTLKDSHGKTALVMARENWALCHKPDPETIISLLIDKDPIAASTDAELSTLCAKLGSTKLLRQLSAHGANLDTKDRYGWTPLALARAFQHAETQAYLERVIWEGMLPSRWVFPSSRSTPTTVISKDGRTVTHNNRERRCLSTDRPLPPSMERYYFEVIFKRLSSSSTPPRDAHEAAIGFCTFGGQPITFPGWKPKDDMRLAKSWGYHSDDGGMYKSSGAGTGPVHSRGYDLGDTVGAGVDLTQNVGWFTKNGQKWHDYEVTDVRGQLFPLLGLHDPLEVEANFNGPFVWNPEEGNKDEL
ncbi:hypothetical protein B0H66DRAFT_515641 [Apodospora peruviana]|uniref:B30.2/SPRY domain-containing protein n=1 Tax=Apodospora peruviana TaxID=516989 RepID=A0AAE0IDE4_9PEZI|nr:hypothetical protein B0H66DRAFT_515641 [Apodospora peruviana]